MNSSNHPDPLTDPPEERKLTAVDLFSGAGGFSLAALNCEFQILGAVEYDKTACESYRSNIVVRHSPRTQLFNENILKIDPSDFRTKLGLNKFDLDLLLGGPPCQGFSSHRINGKGIADPRNELLIRYFDFVKELGPKMFLIENVPGLLWPRHEEYLKKFKNLAKRHGYRLFRPTKLNAKNFGVPQNRERVFILGVRTRLNITKSFVWPPAPTHFAPSKGKPEWLTASSVFPVPPDDVLISLRAKLGESIANNLVFRTDVKPDGVDTSDIHMQHSSDLIIRFTSTPVDGSRHDVDFQLPCHSKEYDGHKDVYGRIRLAQPGPTITTGCINPSKGRFLHPWLNHGISARYAARMQTFPETFQFSGGITSQGKQIGNAVPVKLATTLIGALRSFLITSKAAEA